ncbi:MAG: hypothetical protein AAF078_13040 [Planctomycetota bacterium]
MPRGVLSACCFALGGLCFIGLWGGLIVAAPASALARTGFVVGWLMLSGGVSAGWVAAGLALWNLSGQPPEKMLGSVLPDEVVRLVCRFAFWCFAVQAPILLIAGLILVLAT